MCTIGSQWERVHLLFRDYLRTHAETRWAYKQLKWQLATEYRDDRIAYTDAKSPFIGTTLTAAEEWATETGWTP